MSNKKMNNKTKERLSSSSRIVKAAGMLFGNLEPVTFDYKIDCPPFSCYNCWSLNHHNKDCREPKCGIYCCNCGRKNVQVDECPRCCKAFLEQDQSLKDWIREKFFAGGYKKDCEAKETALTTEDSINDSYKDYDEYLSKYTTEIKKIHGSEDEDCSWEPCEPQHYRATVYVEPNDLFDYLRIKKIRDELSSDEINNVVNLNETRIAEHRSIGENPTLSSDITLKKGALEKASSRLSAEPIQDLLNLLDAIKHLSVKTQEVIILQLMSERKKFSEMQSSDSKNHSS